MEKHAAWFWRFAVMPGKIKVAIAGVGNCASSLVQGAEYYRNVAAGDEHLWVSAPKI